MTDYTELKRLAEAALRNWPDSKLFERPECERFIDASRPDVVLALIAEVDGLHAQHGRDSGELRKVCAERDSARRQRDQLKAENEALRKGMAGDYDLDAWLEFSTGNGPKNAARYQWLRDSEAERGICILNVGSWTAGATCIATTFHSGEMVDEFVDEAMGKGEQP